MRALPVEVTPMSWSDDPPTRENVGEIWLMKYKSQPFVDEVIIREWSCKRVIAIVTKWTDHGQPGHIIDDYLKGKIQWKRRSAQ